jgi:hypothetical protein
MSTFSLMSWAMIALDLRLDRFGMSNSTSPIDIDIHTDVKKTVKLCCQSLCFCSNAGRIQIDTGNRCCVTLANSIPALALQALNLTERLNILAGLR